MNFRIILLFLAVFSAPAQGASLELSHQARSLQPGEVVRITVRSPEPLTSLQVEVFGRAFLFFTSADPSLWEGLVGIDLDTPAGNHEIVLAGRTRSGDRVGGSYTLKVLDKAFETRRLTVDEKFVNPPQESLERIERESRKLNRIFSAVASERIWREPFSSPVPGAPTSGFGKRSILNGQPRSPHSGTDFDADEGVPVKAPSQGKVVLAEDLYFSGNTVILDHGQGLYSYFAHLSRMTVEVGEMIAPGQHVGDVGATGRVTGPHLHWSVRLAGARVDPLSLIAALESETPK